MTQHFTPSDDLQSHIDYLERERKQFLSREPGGSAKALEREFYIAFAIGVGLLILLFITHWVFLMIPIFAVFAYLAFILQSKEKKQKKITHAFWAEYRDFYKDKIIMPLLKTVGKNIVYSEKGSIVEKHSELDSPNLIAAEDLVEMTIEGVSVDFGEMVVEVEDTDSHQKKSETYVVCVAAFNKTFKSRTWVMCGHSKIGKVLGMLPTVIRAGVRPSGSVPDKHILLDDSAFNQRFSVFTDDKVEARYLLTHTMMEKMLAFRQVFPLMSYDFINNKMIFQLRSDFIAMETLNEQFNIQKMSYYELFDYTLDDDIGVQTEHHHELIQNIARLIKLLELDNIIWK